MNVGISSSFSSEGGGGAERRAGCSAGLTYPAGGTGVGRMPRSRNGSTPGAAREAVSAPAAGLSNPVVITVTRISPCIAGSFTVPKMISASSPAASFTTSEIWVTSPSVRSSPPVMLMSTPVAPVMEMLSSSGDEIACCTASMARFSPRPTVLHDGAHVREIYVHDPGDGNEGGDALRGVQQHLVGLLEGVLERNPLAHDGEEALVRHDDHGVDVLAHLGDPHVRLAHPLAPLEQERLGDDADREGANVARHLRDDRRCTGAGAAAHAAGDEDHVGALEGVQHLVAILLDRLSADLGTRAGPQPACELLPDLHLHVGLIVEQGLRVGVHGDELDALESFVDHAVQRVAAAAPHADDFHPGVLRHCLFELEDHGSLG